MKKEVNFIEVAREDMKICLKALGYRIKYRIKEGRVCDKNGTPIVDKYGNKVTLEHVAIVPNPDGEGHILIEYDILTASEYLEELSG